jgi:hypothetical protein
MSTPLTERDWRDSADPLLLLGHLFPMHGFHSTPEQPRKLRLYYAACARRVRDRLSGIHFGLLEAIERLADGTLPGSVIPELMRIGEELAHAQIDEAELTRWIAHLLGCVSSEFPAKQMRHREREPLDWLLYQGVRDVVPSPGWVQTSLHSADSIRDIFPNPFRAAHWNPAWNSQRAREMARGMYSTREFRAMGELADALEEAGCQDADILLHCREEYVAHHRGCWVVDRILDLG